MAATIQHACNRKSDTNPSLFKNDANNVAALQDARLQKKLMEEAARLHQKQLAAAAENLRNEIGDRETLQKELDGSRREIEHINKLAEQHKGELEESKNEVQRLKGQTQEASTEMENLKRQKEAELETLKRQKDAEIEAAKRQRESDLATWENEKRTLTATSTSRTAELETLKQTMSGLERKLPSSQQDNCLPLQYHGATVMIVNLRSQMALDAGRENGTRAHAWEFNLENQNQIYTLTRASDNFTPDGLWVIARKNDNMRIYYPNANHGLDVHVGIGIPGKQDYWCIGRGSDSRVGSWVFKNAEWNTYIELANGSRANGTPVKSYPLTDNMDANWVIIPLSFAS